MSNFSKKVELDTVCHYITVGFVGSMQKEYVEKGIPLLRSLNIKPYKLDLSDIKFISGEFHQKISKSSLSKNDVVVVRTGLPGTSCVIEGDVRELNCSDLVIVRPDSEKVDPYYLSFYFNSIAKKFVNNHAVGAIQQHFNVGSAKKMTIDLPTIRTQRNISNVLNSINKKIELNSRINSELEAMAKLIYEYWFVQFDFLYDFRQGKPADETSRAEDIKPYKSTGGKMVWNKELNRMIPAGWGVKKLGSVLKTCLGGTPSTKVEEYWDGDVPWLNSGEVAHFPIVSSEKKITKEAIRESSTRFLKKGSVLLSITRHLRVNILGIDACINQSIAGVEENDVFKKSYIYFSILHDITRLMSLRSGAQQPHINKETVDDSSFLIADSLVLNSYYKIANPIFERIINNALQNQELASLRDWLLPMLMNGQVTVADEEKLVEEKLGMVAEERGNYINKKR